MKILIVCTLFDTVEANPFVKVLRDGLLQQGNDVVCNVEEFWNPSKFYDLVFFQWPDEFFLKEKPIRPLADIKMQLNQIKEKGIPMVMTIHNLHPHDNNETKLELYHYMFDKMDAFHHMGTFSYDFLIQKYPKAYHFIVPHPCYFDLSDVALTEEECKKKFNLPRNPVVLAFGAFRNDKERKMFIGLSRTFFFKCCFWAHKIHRTIEGKRGILSKAMTRIYYMLNGIKLGHGAINDQTVKEMVKAADIVFIQRSDILNSGNVPLAFSFGKIVIGPDKGNVGRLLKETGNIVFDPDNRESINNSLNCVLNMLRHGTHQGQKNLVYARTILSKNHVAELMNKELLSLVNKH